MSAVLNERDWHLLSLLSDGTFHSGELLAQRLQVSRATVFNLLTSIEEFGITLQRVRGRGYRLSHPWQALQVEQIRHHLGEAAPRFNVEVMAQANSSNAVLLLRAAQGEASGAVLAVELQTAGRGRLGRTWHTGLGNALTFSLLWRFDRGLNALSGLSLAVGLAIVRALQAIATQQVSLKWPNDILSAHGKLGGVLIEAQGDMLGPCAVVIGIGINCTLPLHLEQRIDQPASALDQICVHVVDRNELLASLLRELARVLDDFAVHGFTPMRDEWQSYHARQDRALRLHMPDGSVVDGIARGVTDNGELRVETPQGIRNFNSGEVGV